MELVIKTRNPGKPVNVTQISIGKFPLGKRDYPFKNSVYGGKYEFKAGVNMNLSEILLSSKRG